MKFILALLVTSAAVPAFAATNLVTNGSFETGTLSGWQKFGNPSFTGVTTSIAGFNPTDGLYEAYFGPLQVGGIFQNISTFAGGTYRVSFDMAAAPNGQLFAALWNGASLVSGSFTAGQGFTSYVFYVQGAATSSQLRFRTQHAPSYFAVDNVAVSYVPEPATWAMMIAGFGLVGLSSRRKLTVAA